jgi:hypothetical protein
MQRTKNEEQMKDPTINTMLIFYLHMINKYMNDNCRNEGFGMQRFETNMSTILVELVEGFAQSFEVFTQTLDLLEQSTYKLV